MTVDFVVDGIDRAKCAIIITNRPNEICSVLTQVFESGMTKVDAKGAYSNADKTMIYFAVNRFQITKMKEIVHRIDPAAYIIINDVADVFSANFNKN